MTTRRGVVMAAPAWLFATAARAQAFPVRPIRYIVPVPPGGGSDLIGRTVCERWGKALGQTFVVDNLGGGGGVIASQTTAKAALVQALKDSFAFCDRAYQTADAKLMEKVDIFGQQQDRLYALIMNVGHLNEHYGNLVTYMRLKGLVPPSSQG